MTTFFTADTHFGHARIIEYAKRPFTSVNEMDERMIENWNVHVQRRDTVYHLGDFALGQSERIHQVFARLNGIKHLVLGNHDRVAEMRDLSWASVQHYLRRSVDGVTFCMFHYPMLTWDRRSRNGEDRVASVNLFGHVHSTPTEHKYAWDRCQYDVGVDNNRFAPVSSQDVIAKLRARVAG